MFHFAFTKLVKISAPFRVLLQIASDALGEKDVSSIATIHHSLRDVDASAGNVRLCVQVSDFVDGTTVNSDADAKLGMIFECFADFQRAQHWCLRIISENERATITGR